MLTGLVDGRNLFCRCCVALALAAHSLPSYSAFEVLYHQPNTTIPNKIVFVSMAQSFFSYRKVHAVFPSSFPWSIAFFPSWFPSRYWSSTRSQIQVRQMPGKQSSKQEHGFVHLIMGFQSVAWDIGF